MSATADRLRRFAAATLERHGALLDWPENAAVGDAVLPPALATRLGVRELARVGTVDGGGGRTADGPPIDVRLDLAGDACERLQGLALELPASAAVRASERTPRRMDAVSVLAASLDIRNARVSLLEARAEDLEYHAWQVAASIAGEESWEDLVGVVVAAETGAPVPLADPWLDESWLACRIDSPPRDTRLAALDAAACLAGARAVPTFVRLGQRLNRDRARLRDYYGALLGEGRKARGPAPDATVQAAKRRAVELELARKLAEIEERARLRASLRPVALLRLLLPGWRLSVRIQRRTEVRTLSMAWNHRTGGLEPVRCAHCQTPGRSFLARDADVALLCPSCWTSPAGKA